MSWSHFQRWRKECHETICKNFRKSLCKIRHPKWESCFLLQTRGTCHWELTNGKIFSRHVKIQWEFEDKTSIENPRFELKIRRKYGIFGFFKFFVKLSQISKFVKVQTQIFHSSIFVGFLRSNLNFLDFCLQILIGLQHGGYYRIPEDRLPTLEGHVPGFWGEHDSYFQIGWRTVCPFGTSKAGSWHVREVGLLESCTYLSFSIDQAKFDP